MASNPYVNKVVYDNRILMDITDTTATASDVASGKYFYGADGSKTLGTASGGTLQIVTKSGSASSATSVSINWSDIPNYNQLTVNNFAIKSIKVGGTTNVAAGGNVSLTATMSYSSSSGTLTVKISSHKNMRTRLIDNATVNCLYVE